MIKYSPKTGQFINENGRFVSRASVIKLIDEQQQSLKKALINNAKKYNKGFLTLDEWQANHIELIKLANLRMTILGAGGKKQTTKKHYGAMGSTLKKEWESLSNFTKEIVDGNLSPKQIAFRAGMYSQSSSTAFYKSEFLTKSNEGFNKAKRLLDPQAHHCPECISYQQKRWIDINKIVPPGTNCSCRGNCRCVIIFNKDYRQSSKQKKSP